MEICLDSQFQINFVIQILWLIFFYFIYEIA